MNQPSDPGASLSRRTFLAGSATAAALSISTFAEASQIAIPPGTDVVQTPGFARAGRGAALYVADAAVDRAYAAANPRTAFVAANGRGFQLSLDQVITPFMFGAAGYAGFTQDTVDYSPIPDDTAPLQAFFDFCSTHRIESANWGGAFGVTATVTMGGAFGEDEEDYQSSGVYAGSLVLAVKSNISGSVLRNHERRQAQFGPISIAGPGIGYPVYSDRLFDVGIEFLDKAAVQDWSTIYVSGARVAGVLIRNRVGFLDNVYHNHLQNCFFYACGSGSLHPSTFLPTKFTAHSTSGPGGGGDAVFQRSTLTAATLPPLLLDNIAIPLFVRAGSRLHAVYSVNRRTGVVELYPKLSTSYGATGTLEWVYGGGLAIAGGDSGITTGKVSAINCSTGYIAASAYNGHFVLTAQTCFIAMSIGRFLNDVSNRGTTAIYCEGNIYDVVWNADNRPDQSAHTITSAQNLDLSKWFGFMPRKDDDSIDQFPARALLVNTGDRWLTYENERSVNGAYESAVCAFDRPYAHAIPLHNDNPTISVVSPYAPLQNMFGYRARQFDITGTGPGNTPAGTLTVNPGGGTKKINGGAPGASARFSGFTRPATVQVAIDPADANNFLVSFMGGK